MVHSLNRTAHLQGWVVHRVTFFPRKHFYRFKSIQMCWPAPVDGIRAGCGSVEVLRDTSLELVRAVILNNLSTLDLERPAAVDEFIEHMSGCASADHALEYITEILDAFGLSAPSIRLLVRCGCCRCLS